MKFLGAIIPLLLIYISFCNARISFGLQADATTNTLIKFNSNAPTQILNSVAITGLAAGEVLFGVDFRPSNGALYGVTSSNRIVVINTISGVASQTAILNGCSTPAGTTYAIDFNPQADLLRVISTSAATSFAINVQTGVCTVNGAINGLAAGATVIQVAYTNSFRGATATVLFALTSNGQLGTITPATGLFTGVGSLGQTIGLNAGFDIVGATNNFILASLTVGTTTQLYSINTGTGLATLAGQIGAGATALRSMAISFTDLDRTIVGINNDGNFFRLESEDPSSIVINAITGVPATEFLVGVDFRPSNGLLYGISNNSVLYRVNPLTFVATALGAKLANCVIAGQYFGVDWNPTVDLLRVITDSGINLRINVDANTCVVDGNINGVFTNAPAIGGVAYSNSFAGAGSTVLYGLDYQNDNLVSITPATGLLTLVGAIGANIDPGMGFDIYGATTTTNVAVAIVAIAGVPNFVTIDLITGTTTIIAVTGTVVCRSLSASFNRLPYIVSGSYPDFIVLTNENPQRVVVFNSANPSVSKAAVSVTGIDAGTTLLGMDLRPNGGAVVGLGSNSRLYTVALTGAAFAGGILNCSGSVTSTDSYSLDFNPQADRLRIVSRAGINLRVNVDNAACFVDGPLALPSAIPQAVGVAYSNSVNGTASTSEYIVDATGAGSFSQVTAPNVGTTALIGSFSGLSAAITGAAPLDILTIGTTNYAFTVINGVLYDVNIGSGALRPYGSLSLTANTVIGLTVFPIGYVPPAPPTSTTGSTTGVNSTTTAAGTTGGATTGTGLSTTAFVTSTTSSAVTIVAPFMMLLVAIFALLI